MGWWSESIMGGDQPLDIRCEFEDCFALPRVDEDADPVIGPITADETIAFMQDQITQNDDPVTKQVVGYLLIENQAPLPDAVRSLVLEGINQEINDFSEFDNVAKRHKALNDFASIVEAYPIGGGKVDLPYQPGLFEKILGLAAE